MNEPTTEQDFNERQHGQHLAMESLEQQLQTVSKDFEEAKREREMTRGWFDVYEKVADFMLERGLWDDTDIDENDPAQTLINGLTRFLNYHGYTKCKHEWQVLNGKDRRECIKPECGMIQLWNQNGYWDYPNEEQEKKL